MSDVNKWDEKIINLILLDEEYKITEVKDFEFLKELFFDREIYNSIIGLIKQDDWERLIKIDNKNKENSLTEHLDIVKFNDQNNNKYAATIYDNDALEQDPQIINIFLLN